MNFAANKPEVWVCTNEEYHADLTHDSHSSLDLFHKSVPQYAARRVFKTAAAPPPTPQMLFGSLFHTLVLEPGLFDSEYIKIKEPPDLRTKAGKGTAEVIKADGREPVLEEDYNKAMAMCLGITANSEAKQILESAGKCEFTFRWKDELSGCPLKVRVDKLLDSGTIIDLKTTDDVSPTAWAKTVHNFGYHRQAAMYMDGVKQLTGARPEFIFLACSKTPPHECVCYKLSFRASNFGDIENRRIMRDLQKCRETGVWQSKYAGKVNEVDLPAYAYPRL